MKKLMVAMMVSMVSIMSANADMVASLGIGMSANVNKIAFHKSWGGEKRQINSSDLSYVGTVGWNIKDFDIYAEYEYSRGKLDGLSPISTSSNVITANVAYHISNNLKVFGGIGEERFKARYVKHRKAYNVGASLYLTENVSLDLKYKIRESAKFPISKISGRGTAVYVSYNF